MPRGAQASRQRCNERGYSWGIRELESSRAGLKQIRGATTAHGDNYPRLILLSPPSFPLARAAAAFFADLTCPPFRPSIAAALVSSVFAIRVSWSFCSMGATREAIIPGATKPLVGNNRLWVCNRLGRAVQDEITGLLSL